MPTLDQLTLLARVYASLLLFGGVMGFARRGSKASLVAGGGAGVLALWAAADLAARRNVLLGLAALLAVGMGARAAKAGGAPVPTMVAGISAVVALAAVQTP